MMSRGWRKLLSAARERPVMVRWYFVGLLVISFLAHKAKRTLTIATVRQAIHAMKFHGVHRARKDVALESYRVAGAQLAADSPDHLFPHGAIDARFYEPHYLLTKEVIKRYHPSSWLDIGAGSGSLTLQAIHLGLRKVLAIEGSNRALKSNTVPFNEHNFVVADVTCPLEIKELSGKLAHFDCVSALEVFEHIQEAKLRFVFENIRAVHPRVVVVSVGTQPQPPWHVTLKSTAEWIKLIEEQLAVKYQDQASGEIFQRTGTHKRFTNHYNNPYPGGRNIHLFEAV